MSYCIRQLFFFITVLLFVHASEILRISAAQSAKQVHVCAVDAQEQKGISGARIQLFAESEHFDKLTGADGCAHFKGAIPVSVESPPSGPVLLSMSKPFPNPTSGLFRFHVSTDDARSCEFELFDLLGRSVPVSHQWYRLNDGFEIEADIGHLPEGIYLYRVKSQSNIATGSVVKRADARQRHASYLSPLSTYRDNAGTALSISEGDPSVRVEVSMEGFKDIVEERVFRHGEVVTFTMFRDIQSWVPLNDLQTGLYLDEYQGGLYPGGSNEMPEEHFREGIQRANSIEPLDVEGRPDPEGKIVFTSIGMSTTSSMFCGVADSSEPCKEGTLIDVLSKDTEINHRNLILVDGADPGKVADRWLSPDEKTFDRIEEEELDPLGLSELQVQVAWVNLASTQPEKSLPDPEADAFVLKRQYGDVVRAMKNRYPNLNIVFFSSRVYAGYANSEINPEPYAYESGFAVKWFIEEQLEQMYGDSASADPDVGNLDYASAAPWIAWGPYLWADGTNSRSDGLAWLREDMKGDGTHLARPGVEKFSAIMVEFLKTSPLTRCWVLENGICE